MTIVLLIIHLLVTTGLVAVILMQRSEGGALGIGGGGGGGGMMGGRGSANLLTRTTMILGTVFIVNSITLAVIAGVDADNRSVFDRTGAPASSDQQLPFDFTDSPAIETGEQPAGEEEPAQPDPEIPGR